MGCFRNGKECPYRNSCHDFIEDGSCSNMCPQFHEINILFENANIPKKYTQPYKLYPSKEDIGSYNSLNEIKSNILEMISYGFNIYIFSNKHQNGKTSWAIKILQNYLHCIWNMPGNRKRGLYVDVGEYLKEIKFSFNENNRDMRDFEYDLDNADLVIWDNIDENKLSEWDKGNLKQHIKKRNSNNLSNIFVGTNYDNKLSSIVGSDLKYYIQDNSIIIPLMGERGESNDRITSN